MQFTEEEYLAHYGILRKSGRYPWGTGVNKLQRSKTFLDIIEQHKTVDGMTESEIAKAYDKKDEGYPFTVDDVRALKTRAGAEVTRERIRTATRLRDKGTGMSDIGRQMGVNESTVRSWLDPSRKDKAAQLESIAEMLKREVNEKEFLDVGSQVNLDLPIGNDPANRVGISADKLKVALSMLKEEGYNVRTFKKPQVGTGEPTTYKVLVKPGVTQKEAWQNGDNVRLISEKTDDRGRSFTKLGIQDPLNISSKRVSIRYKEQGGADADGLIYVRPGVPDVSLGKSRYAQVRIAVDGTHYLKGMAVYKDDLPSGTDLQFNTNKSDTGSKHDAMKPLKTVPETGEIDKDNPFGAVIKEGGQILNEKGKVSSAMNLINEEGDWDKWSNTLSSQVLSKQSPDLARSQLNLTFDRRKEEFDQIKALTNPKIKQKLLSTFGEETDSAAVHLSAANMPRQATKVILPSTKVKPNEIFAPTFENGERVSLIRFPHAGLFEIPELTVNNKSQEARKMVGLGQGGKAPDVAVIHPKVAEHLSGADFDGDHVVVIPHLSINPKQIASKPPLEQLKGFDPQEFKVPLGPKTDKFPEGTPSMTKQQKGYEMGNVTNLISDMTIKGASDEELSRAVRHSMVVIDAEKHNLDYKASYQQHGIRDLKRTYQGVHERTGHPRGAATLITRAGSPEYIKKRRLGRVSEGGPINPKTGEKVWVDTEEKNRKGEDATFRTEKLAVRKDAFSLVSDGGGTRIEQLYAEHSNRLKAMANEARREMLGVELTKYNPSAKEQYSHEVDSLKAKLTDAEKNAPLERQAQAVARRTVAQKRQDNPNMEPDELRKIRGQALTEARRRTGAGKTRLGSKDAPITDAEWKAIQAGAITNHMMDRILGNADLNAIRERATPREKHVMSASMTSHAKQLLNAGFTYAEVSERLGVSLSSVKSSVEEGR